MGKETGHSLGSMARDSAYCVSVQPPGKQRLSKQQHRDYLNGTPIATESAIITCILQRFKTSQEGGKLYIEKGKVYVCSL